MLSTARRFKILWITEVEARHHAGQSFHDAFMFIEQKLQLCDPGTAIVKIFYEPMRMSHGLVLQNDAWPLVPEGEYIPSWSPTTKTQQLDDPDIIDVEFASFKTKELESHGTST